jgi:hypothetical protein
MGEAKLEPLRVDFDRRLKLEFHGNDISSDGGLMRAIVDRNGLDRLAASAGQMGRFETEWLATDDNLAALSESGFMTLR